jgi:hypothetical protein
VLKAFLGKRGGEPTASPAGDAQRQGVDVERLKTVIDFFPIGRKLRYYPEFKREIVFDTLIVAYGVNGEFVYSSDAVERDGNGFPAAFRVGDDGSRIALASLRQFQFLIPDTSELERQLDYFRRAEIGRGKQFNKGNYITLMSNAAARGVSTVDTEVAKQVVLTSGPYAHTRMILVTPELGTVEVTDQRKKPRAKTCAPVVLCLPGGGLSGPCVIADISDDSVRVRVRDRETPLPPMAAGAEVTLDIDLGDSGGRHLLKGRVLRRASDACVIHLEGLFESGRLKPFGPLDLLELKAGLINYAN